MQQAADSSVGIMARTLTKPHHSTTGSGCSLAAPALWATEKTYCGRGMDNEGLLVGVRHLRELKMA